MDLIVLHNRYKLVKKNLKIELPSEKRGYDYYKNVVQNILNSEYFANDMKNYINKYETRKKAYRQIISNNMNDTDFSVWFDKLELYSYKTILMGLTHLANYEDEINAIF